MQKLVVSWSGGKDSAMSLYELRRSKQYEIVGLLTTVTSDYDRISMQGVRRILLEQQPVGGMKTTEANLQKDNRVLATLGSREVLGLRGPGAGFLIIGTAKISTSGDQYDLIKKKFPWARAVLEIAANSIEQTI